MTLPATIALRAYNGQYASALNGGGQMLNANGPAIGPWETFNLIDLGNSHVALQAANGQYASALNGGGQVLNANGPAIGPWETFKWVDCGNGHVALQASNGQYASAVNGGGQGVTANGPAIGPWETFTLIDRQRASIIALAACGGVYDFSTALLLPQAGRGAICFTANGTNDVHVGISTSTVASNPMYEIVIGGWNNTLSAIRRSSQGTVVASTPTGLIAPGTNNQLWVAIDSGSGLIQVGRGCVGQNVFLSFTDASFIGAAQYVAFSSWDTPITYTNVRCIALPAKTLAFGDTPGCMAAIGNPAKLNITGKISLSAWIYPQATDGDRYVVARGYVLSPAGEVHLRISNGNYQCGSWDGSDHVANAPMPTSDLNTWVHLTGVYDGQNWLLYRNGLLIAQSPTSVGAVAVSAGWAIGSRGDIIERCFRGYIANVTVWNIALDANGAQRLMIDGVSGLESGLCGYWPLNEGAGPTVRDLALSPQNGTLINTKWVASQRPALPASTLIFSGNPGSCVSLGNPAKLNFSGPCAIAAWVFMQATDGLRNIVSHGYTTSPNGEMYLRINNGNYQCGSWDGGDYSVSAPTPAGDIGKWIHLAGVYDGQNWILYRNGQNIGQVARPRGAFPVAANWAIGAKGDTTDRMMKGSICDVSIWKQALDPAGVQRCMLNQLTGGETGLAGYWPLSEGSGAMLGDLSPAPQNGQGNNVVWSTSATPVDQRDYSSWMTNIPGIDGLRLCDICLPRTHDCGTATLSTTEAPVLYEFEFLRSIYPTVDVDYLLNQVSPNIPTFVHQLIKTGIPAVQPLVNTIVIDAVQGWARSTGLTIAQQLNAGVRWFDLRVCEINNEFRTYHGFTGALLSDIFDQVAAFMARPPREVVILQFSHMDSIVHHATFIDLIQSKLGVYLYPPGGTTTLAQTPIGTMTTNNGVRTSRVIAIYDDSTDSVKAGYSAYAADPSKTIKIWPYNSIDWQKTSGDITGAITSMDQIGTCQTPWLTAFNRSDAQVGGLDFARTPDLQDLLPSILMSILDALQLSAFAGTKQSLRTQSIAANQRLLPFLQQTSVANRAKINFISLDFVEYSYAAYLAVALSRRDQAAIDTPSFLPQLPDSDFTIHQKYSRDFGHFGTPHIDVHADTQVTGHIDSAVIPHADSSGAHSDADMWLFHLDSTPHFDTPSAGHIDAAPLHADTPHADVAHQDVDLHIDAN